MAQRNSSGRGGTATRTKRQAGNQTPNTPTISESEISRMKVDEIRGQLRKRGVSGISALRKPELVKTLAKTLRAERPAGGAARRSTGPAGRATGTRASAGRAAATKKAASGRAAGKAAPGRAQAANKAAPAKKAAAKAAPARKTTSAARKVAPAPARAGTPRGGTTTGVRTGRSTSRSVRSSQLISSTADRPERPGRSLVTTNHEVIQRWARERGAKPATIAGTERAGRAGVLTFNMPGYRESSRIREITWGEWFRTFDERKLNLIYQEQLRNGRPSNFFRTESPDREDA
ncbi:hypothetical protein GA0070610_0125 [Micromonospora echinofusca]|uniref:Rho termination factor, N-terminal domain n=1 Tax=Micromonospora echinofusca TaxID=47858 RepID=A0A1C5G237_MICEH|nr:hypothetical protein [Micromonospora echinofusca]SCG13934.1 hypothetical protein GA0070610_0125 [Micromonospora echinofusca]